MAPRGRKRDAGDQAVDDPPCRKRRRQSTGARAYRGPFSYVIPAERRVTRGMAGANPDITLLPGLTTFRRVAPRAARAAPQADPEPASEHNSPASEHNFPASEHNPPVSEHNLPAQEPAERLSSASASASAAAAGSVSPTASSHHSSSIQSPQGHNESRALTPERPSHHVPPRPSRSPLDDNPLGSGWIQPREGDPRDQEVDVDPQDEDDMYDGDRSGEGGESSDEHPSPSSSSIHSPPAHNDLRALPPALPYMYGSRDECGGRRERWRRGLDRGDKSGEYSDGHRSDHSSSIHSPPAPHKFRALPPPPRYMYGSSDESGGWRQRWRRGLDRSDESREPGNGHPAPSPPPPPSPANRQRAPAGSPLASPPSQRRGRVPTPEEEDSSTCVEEDHPDSPVPSPPPRAPRRPPPQHLLEAAALAVALAPAQVASSVPPELRAPAEPSRSPPELSPTSTLVEYQSPPPPSPPPPTPPPYDRRMFWYYPVQCDESSPDFSPSEPLSPGSRARDRNGNGGEDNGEDYGVDSDNGEDYGVDSDNGEDYGVDNDEDYGVDYDNDEEDQGGEYFADEIAGDYHGDSERNDSFEEDVGGGWGGS